MVVKDLMTTAVVPVQAESPAAAAIKIMRGENVGIVPVCDIQGHLLGVITDRDILMRGDSSKTVQELMTGDVAFVSPRDDIHDAAMTMSQRGVRRLPVVENDRLVGMLSIKDLAKKKIFTAEIGHIIYNICNKKP